MTFIYSLQSFVVTTTRTFPTILPLRSPHYYVSRFPFVRFCSPYVVVDSLPTPTSIHVGDGNVGVPHHTVTGYTLRPVTLPLFIALFQLLRTHVYRLHSTHVYLPRLPTLHYITRYLTSFVPTYSILRVVVTHLHLPLLFDYRYRRCQPPLLFVPFPFVYSLFDCRSRLHSFDIVPTTFTLIRFHLRCSLLGGPRSVVEFTFGGADCYR